MDDAEVAATGRAAFLMERFDFTPEDLEANRRGELSDRQRARYATKGRKRRVAIPVLALFPSYVVGHGIATDGPRETDWVGGAIGFAVVFTILVVLFGWTWWVWFRKPLRDGDLVRISGPVELLSNRRSKTIVIGSGPNHTRWAPKAGDVEFFSRVPFLTVYCSKGILGATIHSVEPPF